MSLTARAMNAVRRHHSLISIAAVFAVAVAGFSALEHLLNEVPPGAVRSAFDGLRAWQIGVSLGLTCASYLVLTLYDTMALRVMGKPLPWRTPTLASFTSYTLSHNLGLALLTGGSARFRIYKAAGLSAGEVGSIIALASLTFWNGVLLLGGLGLVLHPGNVVLLGMTFPLPVQRLAGAALVAFAMAPLVLRRFGVLRARIGGWETPLPDTGQSILMTLVAALDLAVACLALFVLLPDARPELFFVLFNGYVLALIISQITHVPGGVGIFEAVVIVTVPGDKAQLLAALLAYRVIYYLIPLGAAGLLLAWHEGHAWRRPLMTMARGGSALLREFAPMAMGALVFAGGVILLMSGALPALPQRMHVLHEFLPLPFSEASHIAASLAGTFLLFLAPGLWRRLDGAFVATRAVLLAGMVFSITKGIDYEEALVLGAIAATLQWSRTAFYRHTALLAEPLKPEWLGAALIAVAGSVFIGAFTYRHAAMHGELWWQFAAHGDAGRFVRATFGVAVGICGLAIWRLLGPVAAPAPDRLDEALLDTAIALSDSTDAFLSLTGDKQFLIAPEGDAFLMYRVNGSDWIAMGNPVGNRQRWPALLWRLRNLADARQGRVMLYQLTAAALPYAIEIGLDLVKYGEEARVDLSAFSLEGKVAKDMRHAKRRAVACGATFSIFPPEEVAAHLAELNAVSDRWLTLKGGREKSFSMGRFDPGYVTRFPCAVVRIEGRIIAFANVLMTPNRHEASVDLMRHDADIPYGTMDFLFISLIEWARDAGFRWFALGIAPLSGLEARRLASFWTKGGAFLFRHGGQFYGFEGLRSYKAKYATHWEPRYIAASRGMGLARGLASLLRLTRQSAGPGPNSIRFPAIGR